VKLAPNAFTKVLFSTQFSPNTNSGKSSSLSQDEQNVCWLAHHGISGVPGSAG
jgi:hypothetical protein